MMMQNKIETTSKFYTKKAIGIATFIGGPAAAGYLIGVNFRNLNETSKGLTALVLGIVFTLFLLSLGFILPEPVLDKFPSAFLPMIYTGLIYIIVDNTQGKALKEHEEKGNEFFSAWRAAGIGLVSLMLILLLIFGYIFLYDNTDVYSEYDAKMAVFQSNEVESLKFYDHITTSSRLSLIQELDNSVLPKWGENLQIIEELNKLDGLPQELQHQNKLLAEYSLLRIETFKVFRKAIEEDTEQYHNELDEQHRKIDRVLEELNKIQIMKQ